MKSRFPKITRIFLVLALMVGVVGSLVPTSTAKAITAGFAVTVAPAVTGKTASYTFTGVLAAAVSQNDVFTVTFPAGTTFQAGNVALPAGTTMDGPGVAAAAVTSAVGSDSGGSAPKITITASAANADGAGSYAFIIAASVRVVNTATASAAHTIILTKTVGAADAASTSAVFTLTSFVATVSPITVNSLAVYTIVTEIGALAGHQLLEDAGQIVVTFASGTTVPASINANAIYVNAIPTSANGTNAVPPAPPVVVGRVVTITTPVAVASGAALTVIFTAAAGVLNPAWAAATYSLTVATISNVTPEATYSSGYFAITPTITLSPTSGGRSTVVTVTGAGYRASTGVDITYGSVTLASGTSDASGNISIAATVSSTAVRGAGSVVATDGSGTASAVATFTVTSSLTLTPTSGLAGSTVVLSGSNWPASTAVMVGFAGAAATQAGLTTVGSGNATTNANGTMQSVAGGQATGTLFLIPQGATPGTKTFAVTVGAEVVTSTFEVTARALTISPTSGPVGTAVSISATGLSTSGNALPTINGMPWATTLRVLTTAIDAGAGGAALYTSAGATLVSDGVKVGDWAINTTDSSSCRITAVTTTTLACTLAGGTENDWDIGEALVVIAGITIDSSGNLNTTLSIGNANANATATTSTAGVQKIEVVDSGGRIASANFTITSRSLTLTPTTGVARSNVQVTGAGWPVGRTVGLFYTNPGTAEQSWGTATADSAGNIAFIAANLAGAAAASQATTVTARATTAAAVALTAVISTFTVPAAAITVTPAIGATGSNVTIAGTGFQPQSPLNAITLGGVQVHPGTTVVTDASGAWTMVVMVPGVVAGITNVNTTVNITGAPSLTRLFEVTAAADSARVQLNGFGTNLLRVWGFSASTQRYQLYDPAAAAASDLPALVRGGGYWINLTAAQTVVIGSNSYVLLAGWNLIGYLG